MRLMIGVWGVLLAALAAPAHSAQAWREPTTGMEFVAIAKGCFQMGLPDKAFLDQGGDVFMKRLRTEMPQHEVCLDAYWLGRYEVQESEWQKVMGSRPQSGPPNAPVTGVTWDEAQAFARRLTELAGGSALFRLPTEAQWEHACRAGAPVPSVTLPNNDELIDKAWFAGPIAPNTNERLKTVQPVGRKAANAFGLHDMLGNVWEWVLDDYHPDAYAQHSLFNPVVADAQRKRVIRGGGRRTGRHLIRCETRGWMPTQDTQDTVGLRLVRIR